MAVAAAIGVGGFEEGYSQSRSARSKKIATGGAINRKPTTEQVYFAACFFYDKSLFLGKYLDSYIKLFFFVCF